MSFDEYPKIAKSHVQESASKRALEAVFCRPDFISRDITPDYGKDYDVELCKDSSALNIIFSVQLKSVEEVTPVNNSKEIALQIETSRLNYLSETLCGSLIVIYDASSKSLFYEWVHKLTAALDDKGAKWRSQDAATIHVPIDSILDQSSAQTIHQEVLSKHRSIQQLQDGTQLIDAAKNATESAAELGHKKSSSEMLKILSDKGIALVASGLHKEVLAAYALIPSTAWSSDAKHLLVIAFAYEHSGLPLQSLSHANASLVCDKGTLSAEAQLFAKRLALVSKVNLGQIDLDLYYGEIGRLVETSGQGEETKSLRLEIIFRELIRVNRAEDHLARVDKLLAEARSIATDESEWGQQLRLAKIEFQAGDQYVMNGRMQISMSIKLGMPMPMDKRVALAKVALGVKQSALSRVEGICKKAEESKRADVFAACCLELAVHQFSFAMVAQISADNNQQFAQVLANDPQIQTCLKYAARAADLFGQLGIKAMQLKSLRLKADILNASGRKTEAQASLAESRAIALGLGIDPESLKLTDIPSMEPQDVEDGILNATDDDLMHFARSMAQSIRLPEARLQNVFKDLLSVQQITREKKAWCKHIELLQDLKHTQSPATYYAIDPAKACKCLRYGHETKIGHPDYNLVIESFKGTYCKDCPGKEV